MSMVELVNHASNAIFKHTEGYSKSSHKFLYYHTKNFRYYIVITIVERDTGKYHEFIAEYC